MKDLDAVIDAVFILRQNSDSDFEKKLVQDFVENLLHPPSEQTSEKFLYEKTCPVCRTKFQTNRENKKFCSLKCRHKDENSRYQQVNFVCQNCGKVCQASKFFNRKFCSKKCSAEYRRKNKN